MLIQPFLTRPVVIGRNDQGRVGTHRLCMSNKTNRLIGGVGTRTGNDESPPPRRLDAQLHHAAVLSMAQGSGLPSGAYRYKAVHARCNLALNQGHKGLFIHSAIAERCNEGGDNTLEWGLEHELQFAVRWSAVACANDAVADNMSASVLAATPSGLRGFPWSQNFAKDLINIDEPSSCDRRLDACHMHRRCPAGRWPVAWSRAAALRQPGDTGKRSRYSPISAQCGAGRRYRWRANRHGELG